VIVSVLVTALCIETTIALITEFTVQRFIDCLHTKLDSTGLYFVKGKKMGWV